MASNMSEEMKAPKPIAGKISAKVEKTEHHADLKTIYNEFQQLPGEYHMVRLDKQGNEEIGSDFSIKPREYNRTYSKLPNKFKVKKSPL